MLDEFINNTLSRVYRKYNWMWTFMRKEPFLGTYVNNNIIDGFKKHLKHDENKIYEKIKYNDKIFVNAENILITKSNALNYEFMKLSSISKSLCEYIVKNMEDKKKINFDILKNTLNNINLLNDKLIANTFFLIKNSKLEDFNDVRMIIVMPVLVKIFESLIFSDVSDYISSIIKVKNYQFGGIKRGSTYEALLNYRIKCEKNNSRNSFLLDMTKGYDCINLDILENMIIDKIKNARIQALCLYWVKIVKNLDIDMNGTIVKKKRGIPMGLSLSPAFFVFYLDCILNDDDIKYITAYIDDLIISFPNSFSYIRQKEKLLDLIKKLGKYDLIINLKKSCALSNDIYFKEFFKNLLPVKDSEKYLGRELCVNNNGYIVNDDRFYLNGKNVLGQPNWINFSIKRMIFNGALDARIRYKFTMWPCDDIKIRNKIWTNSWLFFKNKNTEFSYVQLALISLNIFRYMLDPLLIIKLNNKLLCNLNNDKFNEVLLLECNNIVRNKLRCDKKQIDDIINNISPEWSYNYNFVNEYPLDFVKKFTDKLWNDFKDKIIENYCNSKRINGINVYNPIPKKSKLIRNISFISDIIFNRVSKCRFKQMLLFKFINKLNDVFDDWEKTKYDRVINLNFQLEKDIFYMKFNDVNWTIYVKKKNEELWPFIYRLMALEKKCKNRLKLNINKLLENANKKLSSGKKLNSYETFLMSLDNYMLDLYIKNWEINSKKRYNNIKTSFKLIFKKLLIFDTIYGDKYYNNSTYDELYYNIIFKFDDLDLLSDKILKVIDSEENLNECEYF